LLAISPVIVFGTRFEKSSPSLYNVRSYRIQKLPKIMSRAPKAQVPFRTVSTKTSIAKRAPSSGRVEDAKVLAREMIFGMNTFGTRYEAMAVMCKGR
jgi:hypothetical protein